MWYGRYTSKRKKVSHTHTSPLGVVTAVRRGSISSLMLDRKFWEIRRASCSRAKSGCSFGVCLSRSWINTTHQQVRMNPPVKGIKENWCDVGVRGFLSHLCGLNVRICAFTMYCEPQEVLPQIIKALVNTSSRLASVYWLNRLRSELIPVIRSDYHDVTACFLVWVVLIVGIRLTRQPATPHKPTRLLSLLTPPSYSRTGNEN